MSEFERAMILMQAAQMAMLREIAGSISRARHSNCLDIQAKLGNKLFNTCPRVAVVLSEVDRG